MPIMFYGHPQDPTLLYRQWGVAVEVYNPITRSWKPMPFIDYQRLLPIRTTLTSEAAQEKIADLHVAAEKASKAALVRTAVTPKNGMLSSNPHPTLVGRGFVYPLSSCLALRLIGVLASEAKRYIH